MPDVSYSYRVKIGGHEWTANMGDAPDYGPADGLQIIRKLRDSDLWPTVEEAAECRFQLVVESAADVPGVQLGAAVAVEYKTPAGGAIRQAFYGRVAELTSSPHDLGLVFQVNCLDYTADLKEPTVGGVVAYPAEGILTRLNRIMAEAGYAAFSVWQHPPGSGILPTDIPDVAVRDPQPANLYELLDSYLQQWPADYGYGPTSVQYLGRARMGIVPVVAADVLTGFQLVPKFERPTYTGPLVFTVSGVQWAVEPSLTGSNMIDAGQLDFSASYAQTKLDSPTRVTVSGDKFTAGEATLTADLGVVPPIEASIDSVELLDLSDGTELAAMYLTDYLPVSRWVADEFLRHVELAPANATVPGLGAVVTIYELDPAQNPNQRSWFAGQLASYTLTIADKRPTVTFQLRRPDFAVPNTGVILWNSASLVGKTWANLSPTVTWDDMRLVRS